MREHIYVNNIIIKLYNCHINQDLVIVTHIIVTPMLLISLWSHDRASVLGLV